MKQKASATDNATSVIGGNSALFRSGHGRCSRPEVAVILPASQRLSVSVIMATIVAAAGAMIDQRIDPSFGIACRGRVARAENSQQAAPQRAGDGLGVGAERQQRGDRGQDGKARDPEQDAADRIPFHARAAAGAAPLPDPALATGRPSSARWPSHQAGSATVTTKAMQ